MSLLGKIVKGAGKLLSSPVGKVASRFIPGVGTAIAVGSTIYGALPRGGGGATPPTFPRPLTLPNTPTPAPNDSLSGLFESRVGRRPTGEEYQIMSAIINNDTRGIEGVNLAITALNNGEPLLSYWERVFGGNPGDALGGIGTMGVATMGGAPGWGQLGRRAVAVAPAVGRAVARKAGKWITIGAGVWGLVDALGNVIQTTNKNPRRRMNVLNPRALAKAHRRMDGFRNVATKNLRHYGYTVSRTAKPKGKKRRKH